MYFPPSLSRGGRANRPNWASGVIYCLRSRCSASGRTEVRTRSGTPPICALFNKSVQIHGFSEGALHMRDKSGFIFFRRALTSVLAIFGFALTLFAAQSAASQEQVLYNFFNVGD